MKKSKTWSRRLERNILRVYELANDLDRADGLRWYASAHEQAILTADRNGITLEQSAGVIAAISPGLQWGLNVMQAESLIRAYLAHAELPMVGVYGRKNVDKAIRILEGEAPLEVLPLTGPKVRAFYACILNPQTSTEVCVDRHAKCLALGLRGTRKGAASSNKDAIVQPAQYPYYAWHYRKLAERLGLVPHQLQAITWVAWRRTA